MNNICTILLARLGSSRLPKKHLKKFSDTTVIEFMFKRARLLNNWPNFILGTTLKSEDDKLEMIASNYGIKTFRGSEEDVALRLIEASNLTNANWIHRLNGDNIFFDYELINEAISMISSDTDIKLFSNVTETKTPGFTVEIINKDFLVDNYQFMSSIQKEHVTQYFYENTKNSKIHWLKNKKNLCALAIDTQDDLDRAIQLTMDPFNFDYLSPVSEIEKKMGIDL
jgi:spore coat polysaccharide biosynthesis protein SpsF